MSGTTIVTIGLLGTGQITSSGTYELDVAAVGVANVEGPGASGAPITADLVGLVGIEAAFTTDISNGANVFLNPTVGISAIETYRLSENSMGLINGNGTWEFGSPLIGATLDQSINLCGNDNRVILDPGLSPSLLDAINNFAPSDTIEIKEIRSATQAVFTPNNGLLGSAPGGTIALENASGSVVGDIVLATGSFAPNAFMVTPDPHGGVDLSVCFLEGTQIQLAAGGRAVEDLQEGDLIVTKGGALKPIKWIGRRRINTQRHAASETLWPIRIAASAIADGVPSRDLFISPDHGIYLDGLLVPAKALVNGRSIVQMRRSHFSYYHIELAQHAVIYAESLPVESYLDTGNRRLFENAEGPVALHPTAQAQESRGSQGCAPFAERGQAVSAIRARIIGRLGLRGATYDCHLRVISDRRMLLVRVISATCYEVTLPDINDDLLLFSRVVVPAEWEPDSHDWRKLGLDVAALELVSDRGAAPIPIDSANLCFGWHNHEDDHRWTDGCAAIPAELLVGGDRLIIHLNSVLAYPAELDHQVKIS
jgi:hypothetical protein